MAKKKKKIECNSVDTQILRINLNLVVIAHLLSVYFYGIEYTDARGGIY